MNEFIKIRPQFSLLWNDPEPNKVIVAARGSGKTVLARHYLQIIDCKIKAEINAESIENILNSFKELSLALADTKELRKDLAYIKAIRDKNLQIKQAVHFVFSQLEKKGNWCLLFDNVDDFNTIHDFIPPKDSIYNEGKIIITTRNGNFKNIGMFSKNAIIDVPLLTESEGEELFSNIICTDKRTDPGNILRDFWKHIPLMPLDICAAAYYMKNTNISCEDYLNVINKPNVDFEKLQSTFLKEGINYDNSRYAILASIFEKIIKVETSFKKLLLLICLLDSQNIPISYLERSTDHVTTQKFLYELRRFSLITEKGSTFSVHRSTQSVGQKYIFSILSKEERELMIDDIVKIMTPYKRIVGYLFDEKDKTGWFTIKKAVELLPHTNTLRRNILHLKVKNWHKYSVRLKMTEFLGKEYYEPRLTLRKIANEILEENHNYFSDDELAILVLERAYCIYGNISDCSDEDLLVASFNKSSYEGMKSALAIYLARINLEKSNPMEVLVR
ncbi:MAG: hypothetical protein IJ730_06685 [Alphaproteobacteria bacterium]|nr:hypothetical protein [Alphaproteobacteria bacterium]